jgi:hypothetical protein
MNADCYSYVLVEPYTFPWVSAPMKNKIKSLVCKLMGRASRVEEKPVSLGVIAIMKNESLNIREWIEHYRWQGVDKIFLIDNGSTDNVRSIICEDVDSGFIEYFWRPARHKQVAHYRDVYKKAKIGSKVDWLIMSDLDEFWFSPLGCLKKSIDFIDKDADLIYSNWLVFGSSGCVQHPSSLREALVYRHPQYGGHRNTKWICRTRSIKRSRAIGIHKVRWIDSRRVVSDNETFKLNHYVIQSIHYFQEVKMKRGDVSSARFENVRTREYFNSFDNQATTLDETLADLVRLTESSMRDSV